MNTRTNGQKLSKLTLGTLSALALLLAACGEQTEEQQQSSAPTTEQPTESTTQ